MPDTLQGINNFVEKVLSEIEPRQALPLLIKLTAMGKIIEGLKDGLKDQLLEEASLTAEKSFTIDGVRLTKTNRTTYYYNHCAKWNALNEELKALQEMMKAAKEPFADVETGEVIHPARQSGSESISVTLNKE
jgi:uridine kinase